MGDLLVEESWILEDVQEISEIALTGLPIYGWSTATISGFTQSFRDVIP